METPLDRPTNDAVRVSDLMSLWESMRRAIAESKEDLRSDILAGHEELLDRIKDVAQEAEMVAAAQRDFASVHAQEHIAESKDRRIWEDKLTALIKIEDLSRARRDGILGAVRFVINLVGNNYKGIIALGGLLGVVLGNIHVSFGAPQ